MKGVYHDAYVMIDIYSRYIVGARVHARECGPLAESMMREVFGVHGVPHVVHADRGTSMTSKSVADLLEDLDVTRSHSRPKVSNDNPYSEAWFKMLKYAPVFPDRFASLAHARTFMNDFVTWYNHAHRHSGIGLHTPPTSTTAVTTPSAPTARTPSPQPARHTRNGSAPPSPCPRSSTCPNKSGSTNPNRTNKPLNSRWPHSLDTFRLAAARDHGIIEALASADVMTFADKGYQRARGSVRTPFKRRRFRPKLSRRQKAVKPGAREDPCSR